MAQTQRKIAGRPERATVLAKAFIRAGDNLGLSSRALSQVVGLSEASISRLRQGATNVLSNPRTFELAALFVRLYRSLDAIAGGDDRVAHAWLNNSNTVLRDRPVNLIGSIEGLVRVIHYLDSRRALI
jgi:transcriptional regulator with XRE-family HTH domain